MTTPHFYPVGTPGQPWGDAERAAWRARQLVQRSYADDVVAALNALPEAFTVVQYGDLQAGTDRYPLLLAPEGSAFADAAGGGAGAWCDPRAWSCGGGT